MNVCMASTRNTHLGGGVAEETKCDGAPISVMVSLPSSDLVTRVS